MAKDTTIETTNTRVFLKSVILFFSILMVFIRFGDLFAALDRSDGLLYLGRETHMIRNTYDCVLCICIALCSGGIFYLRIALCVPQPRIFLLLSLIIFYLLLLL